MVAMVLVPSRLLYGVMLFDLTWSLCLTEVLLLTLGVGRLSGERMGAGTWATSCGVGYVSGNGMDIDTSAAAWVGLACGGCTGAPSETTVQVVGGLGREWSPSDIIWQLLLSGCVG
jgi:hypothetical protein